MKMNEPMKTIFNSRFPKVAVICTDEERLKKIAPAVTGSLGAEMAARVIYAKRCVGGLALLSLVLWWSGCVSPKVPEVEPVDYDTKVPLAAAFYMEKSDQEAVSSRGTLKISTGQFVHRYALVGLTKGFTHFAESPTLPPAGEHDVLISIKGLKHKLDVPFPGSTFILDLEVPVQVDSRQGKRLMDEVLKDKITVRQSSSAGGMLAALELSPRFETAIHRSLTKMFKELMETIQDESKKWELPAKASVPPPP